MKLISKTGAVLVLALLGGCQEPGNVFSLVVGSCFDDMELAKLAGSARGTAQ